jgi:hypothetical protein
MTVTVKIHDYARTEYEAWMARHSQPPTGSPEMAKLLYDELVAELVRTHGEPKGVERVAMGELSHFLWRYSSDTFVRFVLHKVPGSFFRKAVLKVVITSISDSADG